MSTISISRHVEDQNAPCKCDNCDWRGPVSALGDIHDAEERLYPGETVPAGECPECGAFAHLEVKEGDFDFVNTAAWSQPISH